MQSARFRSQRSALLLPNRSLVLLVALVLACTMLAYTGSYRPISHITLRDCSHGISAMLAGGAISPALMEQLLPKTNFTQLQSAVLLDAAAAAGCSKQQVSSLMQWHQALFCATKPAKLPGSITVSVGNYMQLHVYKDNDVVSESINTNEQWETNELQEMLWAILQYNSPKQQRALAALQQSTAQLGSSRQYGRAKGRALQQQHEQPLVLDIGANVGWFGLNAAAANARVSLFEAMPDNVALLRRTICSNPKFAQYITLYGTGLGATSGNCYIMADVDNKGDGHTVCTKDANQGLQQLEEKFKHKFKFEVRGAMTVRRLDDLISEDVQVMKIDVEGLELQVLEGAAGLLSQHNVWYIMAECNKAFVHADGQAKYLKYLDRMGYAISEKGFQGPFFEVEDIKKGKVAFYSDNPNLYCVNKKLLAAV